MLKKHKLAVIISSLIIDKVENQTHKIPNNATNALFGDGLVTENCQ